MMSDIAEIYDMSDNELFILLMGSTDHDSILPIIQFVKSVFESRVAFDVYVAYSEYFVTYVCV